MFLVQFLDLFARYIIRMILKMKEESFSVGVRSSRVVRSNRSPGFYRRGGCQDEFSDLVAFPSSVEQMSVKLSDEVKVVCFVGILGVVTTDEAVYCTFDAAQGVGRCRWQVEK